MIHRYQEIDSTNTRAKEMALEGAPHGTVLIAESQTGGRGRLGRSFHSPPGSGIYLSMLLRPECDATELMHLTCAVAVAVCDAIEEATGLRPGIKWTNDIVYGKKKLGGILTELGFEGNRVSFAVIGVGLNVSQTAGDFPTELQDMAASLSMVCKNEVPREKLEAKLISHLQEMAESLIMKKEAMLCQYRRDCITLGQQVSIHRADEVRYGTALDVDDDGALLVRYENGETSAVSSGEVSVRGMYGYV